jgi:hypothetical protein
MGADMNQQQTISVAYDTPEQAAFAQAVREWKASGERFSAAKVLARRDEILGR